MKKILFLLIILLKSLLTFSQYECVLNPKDSLYYKDGKLCNGFDSVIVAPEFPSFVTIAKYSNGYKEYEQDFEVKTRGIHSSKRLFKNNKIVDGSITLYQYGSKQLPERTYICKNGNLNGMFYIYSKSKPNYIIQYGYYIDGKKEGNFFTVSDSGRIELIETYKHDTLANKISFYPNGMIDEQISFCGFDPIELRNMPDGPYWEYYEDGKQMITGEYKKGKHIGAFIYWNKFNINKVERYDDYGKLIETIEYVYDGINLIEKKIMKP